MDDNSALYGVGGSETARFWNGYSALQGYPDLCRPQATEDPS